MVGSVHVVHIMGVTIRTVPGIGLRGSLSRSLSIFVPVVAVEGSNISVVLPGDGVQVLAVVQVNHVVAVFLTEGIEFLGILRVEEGLKRVLFVTTIPRASRIFSIL